MITRNRPDETFGSVICPLQIVVPPGPAAGASCTAGVAKSWSQPSSSAGLRALLSTACPATANELRPVPSSSSENVVAGCGTASVNAPTVGAGVVGADLYSGSSPQSEANGFTRSGIGDAPVQMTTPSCSPSPE